MQILRSLTIIKYSRHCEEIAQTIRQWRTVAIYQIYSTSLLNQQSATAELRSDKSELATIDVGILKCRSS